ncbi:MAG: alkaline phosphatase D family protein [Novosphingobium sp.]
MMTKRNLGGQVSRRALLVGMAGVGALAAVPGLADAATLPDGAVFTHGVASGDPDATSLIIWTRVTVAAEPDVTWEVAATPDFRRVQRHGKVTAGAERDHTVKVLVEGLKPGTTYHYRFRVGAAVSPTGRARTLPVGRLESLGIALVTCSNYAFGFFNAYDAIAKDPRVDFVLHTGDYIYEYGADQWGASVAHSIGRVHQPAHEIVSLDDYRQRHAQYKTDAGSRAMHGAHTFLACWDDHEVCNNPWTGGADNHQPATEGDWPTRRANAIRAYYEWMPVRDPASGHSPLQFWRNYSFGDLALLHTLETRHTARARQIDFLEYALTLTSAEAAARFRKEVLGAPDRRMISTELEHDLGKALAASVEAGQPWRLIGNASLIARIDVPDLVRTGLLPDPTPKLADTSFDALRRAAKEPATVLAWKGQLSLPFYTDPWDGYPWARERLYALSREAGAGDLIFLSGDSHSFWQNRLADDAGQPAGIEFGTAGVSSPGDFMESGFGPELSQKLDRAFADFNSEVLWTDNMHQGYVLVELGRQSGSASFIGVSTVLSPDYRPELLKRVNFLRGNGSVDFV